MPELTNKTLIEREKLVALADQRLCDADELAKARRWVAAVYLAGYSVECLLKAKICKSLDLDKLPALFAIHRLDLPVFYSGLERSLDSNHDVKESFNKVCGMWKVDIHDSIRYKDGSLFGEEEWKRFDNWLRGAPGGLIPWLHKQL